MIGQTIRHYEVTAKLGQGGMGEVYRARDTRLNRDVALKVLPETFARDEQRMRRFSREAQLLASLNHPNIAAIFGLETRDSEEEAGTKCLVMELVEGEDLSERIAQGPIPLQEALRIALQIVEALENAHEKGIIHRDLKPANIKVTPDGKVKILDFGLAKALEDPGSDVDSQPSGLSQSPTLSIAATQAGVILGTAAYMSPEQARGKAADRRVDIWAFGCVLFEMLSGTQVFKGSDVSEIMARVITDEPNWDALPRDLPAPVLRLLQRSLRKDPATRLPNAAMIRITIQDFLDDPEASAPVRPRQRLGGLAGAVLVCAGLLIGFALSFLVWSESANAPAELTQVDLVLNPPVELTQSPILSPDGRTLVYAARARGTTQLFRRDLAESESRGIPGTEGGLSPFFSADGRWIAFFAGGRLKKVLLEGGQPIPVCVYSGEAVGGVWMRDDRILFLSTGATGPQVVPAEGGTVTMLGSDDDPDVVLRGSPQLLPGGVQILVTVRSLQRPEEAYVGLLDGSSGRLKRLVAGSDARVINPGLISYLYGGSLMIATFDQGKGTIGPGRVAPVDVESYEGTVGRYFRGTFSSSGTAILEAERVSALERVVWIDWEGNVISERELGFLRGRIFGQVFFQVRLSPDGTKLVVTGRSDVEILNLENDQLTTIISENGPSGASYGHWRPDGESIAFINNVSGRFMTYQIPADGNGDMQLITDWNLPSIGTDSSPDGKHLLGYVISPETSRDLVLFPMDGGEPLSILRTNSNERAPVFSPNGKLIAFLSDEDGTDQVYLREYPNGTRNIRVSTDGGSSAIWSRDGKNLFYRTPEALMRVEVQENPILQVSLPKHLFDASRYPIENYGIASYDISLDDRHFLFPEVQRQGIERWRVIFNSDLMFAEMFDE